MSNFLDETGLRHLWSKITNAIPKSATTNPKRADTNANTGSSTKYAREDHVHPKQVVYDNDLSWGGPNISSDVSPIDSAMIPIVGYNKAELSRPDGVFVEYSTDAGENWSEYELADSSKIGLLSCALSGTVYIGKKSQPSSGTVTLDDQLRITVNAHDCGFYTRLKKVLINISTNGATYCTVLVEKSKGATIDTFETIGTFSIGGWSGWNSIPVGNISFGGGSSQTSNYWALRFTFKIGGLSTKYQSNLQVSNVLFIGTTTWSFPSNIAKTGHLYEYGTTGNATFPASVTAKSFYGNTQNTKVETLMNYAEKKDLANGDTLGILFGKISFWLKSLKALAFKDTVTKSDLADDIARSLLPTITEADEGKVFGIVNGAWAFVDLPADLTETVEVVSTSLAEHTQDTDIHVTAEEKAKWNAGGGGSASKPKAVLVSLYPAFWEASTKNQTVDVAGALADESKQLVTIIPSAGYDTTYYASGIQASVDSDGKTTFSCINIPTSIIKVWVIMTDVEDVTPSTPYLTFSSPESFSISVANPGWDGTMEYSADASTWTTWTGTSIESAAKGDRYYLYFRGTGNTIIGSNSNNCNWTLSGNAIACLGNIEYLLDYKTVIAGSHPIMGEYCYCNIFYNCAGLIQAPELPAITLSKGCYKDIFYKCTSLTVAPELPAMEMAESCYDSMFDKCTSLTAAPKLPAMVLAKNCYHWMFSDCTSLTVAPKLPATTMVENCYIQMFDGCTALTVAPELPAAVMASYCYSNMFYNCTSLTVAPKLPSTSLASGCYSNMFFGCSSLTVAPELPATTMANSCYQSMFGNCTALTIAPKLPATTLEYYCYNKMFFRCSSLTVAPELPATNVSYNSYREMFRECTSLVFSPSLPAKTLGYACYSNMFYGCTNLVGIPELPAETLVSNCYYGMFYNCNKIKISASMTGNYASIYPLPSTTVNDAFKNMFYGTGGTFTGTPTGGTTYYIDISNPIISVS